MRTILVGVCAVLVGCVTEGPDLGSTSSDVETANRLASNALSANRLASNRLASNGLASATTTLTELADNADGRELLTYLVSCALPSGASITAVDSTGIAHTFAGSIGLAPAWATQTPTLADRHWVTACLLARTNAYGITVKLSLRGSSPALAVSSAEKSAYHSYEGAFWGDLWAGDPRPMNTCESRLAATDPTKGTFSLRSCSESEVGVTTVCGFTAVGICEDVCTKTNCTASGIVWPEVIFVYLDGN